MTTSLQLTSLAPWALAAEGEALGRLQRAPGGTAPEVRTVLRAAARMDAADLSGARCALVTLLAGGAETPAARAVRLVARALYNRCVGHQGSAGNLYLAQPAGGAFTQPGPSMLAAFETLTEAVPMVRFGHAVANAAIVAAAPRDRRMHIVDVGIGNGAQWDDLMDTLPFGRGPTRWHIKLTGVEVDGGPDTLARLQAVGARLKARARTRGTALYFRPVVGAVQDLDLTTVVRHGEAVVVNAALALHHVPTGDGCPQGAVGAAGGDVRDALLARIRRVSPRRLVLVEPDVEHNALEGRLAGRLAESLSHYLTVFDALGTLLAGEPAARRTLEEDFFGREIANICAEGPARVERHERLTRWRTRLARAGFKPSSMSRALPDLPREMRLPAGMDVADRDGALVLAWKAAPLLAASSWACA